MTKRKTTLRPHSKHKLCCCGGHNQRNAKKNRHCHSTRVKLERRKKRRAKR